MEYSDLEQLTRLIQQRGGLGQDATAVKKDGQSDGQPIYFDQTTRHIGSIQKNMLFSQNDDSYFVGAAKKGMSSSTAPDYSVMKGLYKKGNMEATYMPNQLKGAQEEENKRRDDRNNSNVKSDDSFEARGKGNRALPSDSDDSGVDEEEQDPFADDVDAMYEVQKAKAEEAQSRSFDDKKSELPNPKAERKLSNEEGKSKKKQQPKVLTFVDMSHLGYLSKSMDRNNLFDRKPMQVAMPLTTENPIFEEEEEQDEQDEEEGTFEVQSPVKVKVDESTDVARYFISQMISLVFEAEQDDVDAEIVDNSKLSANLQSLHKQVFVKCKVEEDLLKNRSKNSFGLRDSAPRLQKKKNTSVGSLPVNSSSFESLHHNDGQSTSASSKESSGASLSKNAFRRSLAKRGRLEKESFIGKDRQTRKMKEEERNAEEKKNVIRESAIYSGLSDALNQQDSDEFVIQAPGKRDPCYIKVKVYFFNTPKSIVIEISTKDVARDVIRHIMTLYKHHPLGQVNPLKYPETPDRYQLWLVDEYESEFAPDDEMGPRDIDEEIGQFSALAFMDNKKYKENNEKQDIQVIEEEYARELAQENKKLIKVICNTTMSQGANYVITLRNEDRASEIFTQVNRKKQTGLPFNSKRFVLLSVFEPGEKGKHDKETELLTNMFGGYNAFGIDQRVIDPESIVQNLKTNKIELTEKIFVDKPVSKQREITFEQKQHVVAASVLQKKTSIGGSGSNMLDMDLKMGAQTYAGDSRLGAATARMPNNNSIDMRGEEKKQVKYYRDEDDFLYGQISGSQLQEFRVIKINRKNKAQERMLCIDGFNIYNKKLSEKQGFSLSSILPTSLFNVKRKQRPINSIQKFRRLSEDEFSVQFTKEKPNDDPKEIYYKTMNPDDCSHILAKLRFLRYQNQSKIGSYQQQRTNTQMF